MHCSLAHSPLNPIFSHSFPFHLAAAISVSSPSELRLDVKKSSYKKVSKFLATMQSKGVITLKETEKGSDVISEIDFKHPL